MTNRLVELCFEGFGVFHSGITATPFWSAQHLTKQRVIDAKGVDRVDSFRAEPRLPASDRAELSHYSRSGFDRGHLAPAADMDTYASQEASFSLANMVPQEASLNRKLWADMEATTRALALRYGDVYVVTGTAFSGSQLRQLKGRVYVPSAMYKAIYIPSLSVASVWWAANEAPGKTYENITVDELKHRAGVDVFPGLDPRIKAQAVALPKPTASADRVDPGLVTKREKPIGEAPSPAESVDWYSIIKNLLLHFIWGLFK